MIVTFNLNGEPAHARVERPLSLLDLLHDGFDMECEYLCKKEGLG